MGIYAGSTPFESKGKVALGLSFVLGSFVGFTLFDITKNHLPHFPKALHLDLKLSFALFLGSWTLFPIIFVLSWPPIAKISFSQANIGFALGDLLAKNLFGIVMWYVTWKLLLPLKMESLKVMGKDEKVQNVDHTDLSVARHLDPLAHENEAGIRSFVAGNILGRSGGAFHEPQFNDDGTLVSPDLNMLIVESHPAYQKLLTYMFEKENVSVVFAFDFETAIPSLSREHCERYDCILINLDNATRNPKAAANLKQVASKDPYFLSIIGYSLEGSNSKDSKREFCDDVARHPLDERSFADLIMHWRQASELKRSQAEMILAQKEHALSSPRVHTHQRRHFTSRSNSRDNTSSTIVTPEPRQLTIERTNSSHTMSDDSDGENTPSHSPVSSRRVRIVTS